MSKPVVIIDAHWRRMDELFSPLTTIELHQQFDIVWGRDEPIPHSVLNDALPTAQVLIAETPKVSAKTLALAPNLHTIIEVSGAFPDTIDYTACFSKGVEVLSCAPGFRQSVAEMGLAMALAGARGLVSEHEAFRTGEEHWLADKPETDFTLFGAQIGFVGFGQIAQELRRLLVPFRPDIIAFDPWLPQAVATAHDVALRPLEDVLTSARCLFITASPTSENHHLMNADRLALLQDNALLVLLSRAHLVDFDALTAELRSERIRACIDVFPSEPVDEKDDIRKMKSAILSPHRAAAIKNGRRLIGDMILADLNAKQSGSSKRQLSKASKDTISALAGVGDAKKVADMAKSRT